MQGYICICLLSLVVDYMPTDIVRWTRDQVIVRMSFIYFFLSPLCEVEGDIEEQFLNRTEEILPAQLIYATFWAFFFLMLLCMPIYDIWVGVG